MLFPNVLFRPCLISLLLLVLLFEAYGNHPFPKDLDLHVNNHELSLDSLQKEDEIKNLYSAFDVAMDNIYQAFLRGEAGLNDLWKLAEYAKTYDMHTSLYHTDLQTPSLRQIQSNLESDQCLFAFYHQTGNSNVSERLYAFQITRAQTYLHVQTNTDLQSLIEDYLTQLSKPPSHFWHKEQSLYNLFIIHSLGWQLKNALFGETDVQKFKELVFIPHKDIYRMPFAALPSENVEVRSLQNWKSYPFLIKTSRISYAFSVAWWLSGQTSPVMNDGIVFAPDSDLAHLERRETSKHLNILTIKDPQRLRYILLKEPCPWLYISMHGNKSSGMKLPDFSEFSLNGGTVILAMCTSINIRASDKSLSVPPYLLQLIEAGADNICGSIWDIPDIQTGKIFTKLFKKKPTDILDLQQFLDDHLHQTSGLLHHPYYWAAWIMFSKRGNR